MRRLFVVGREDDMIVSGGENVFPAEVEELLGTHACVREVTVRLARYKTPREVVFLDELPRNALGKIVRRELPS
jgi:fatty-acyl-CoA synthase